MVDIAKVKSNVAKMVAQGAPEEDIDGYIALTGFTINDIRNFKSTQNQQPEQRSLAGEIARPFLRTAKSIVTATVGNSGDLAQEALHLPAYLGRSGARALEKAIYGDNIIPAYDTSKINTASPTIREFFDSATDGLTKPRNKTEENLETAQEIFGGMVGPATVSSVVNATKNLVTTGVKKGIQKLIGVDQAALKAFEDAGINPRLADISSSKPTKAFQNLLEFFPGSASTIQRATQKQVDDITKQLVGVTGDDGGTVQQTGKKIQEGAKEFKGFVKNRVDKLYDDLDQFVLTESQKRSNPKLMEAIDEWTKLKEVEKHLVSNIQGNAKAASTVGSSSVYSNEYKSLKNLEEDLTASVKGNATVYGAVNEDAANKLGFWRNRAREKGKEFINEAAEDARSLQNVKKQIAEEAKKSKPANSEFLSMAAEDAKSLANLRKQISSQEKIISNFEKYMSPAQFESALMSGEAKIPTNNLSRLTGDSEIQDVAAVGSGDTSRVINRYMNIVDNDGNISYPRLKTFRSTIGAKLQSPSLGGDERRALKRIYGAISDDMKDAIIANSGEKGLQAFNKANNAFSRSQELLEKSINPLIDAKTPEAVYQLALSGSKQGGSNIKPIMRALKPDQQEFVRGTIVRRMGTQNPGLQDATGEVFSPNKFLTEWNKLSPEAKTNIFKPEQIRGIDNLNKSIHNIKETSKIAQKSYNVPYMNWLGLIGGVAASPVTIPQATGAVVGARISAEMMTNPKFINWLAKAPKVKPQAIPNHLKELSIIAGQNSALREDILSYLDSITIGKNKEEDGTSF